jgi:DNA-binding phage protein
MVRVSEFDPSAVLDDDEVVAEYLTAALEDHNPEVFLAAVGHVDLNIFVVDFKGANCRLKSP